MNEPDNKSDVGIRDRAILECLYGSGLRLMELCQLTLNDVDTQRGEITIRQGKYSKDRTIPLTNQACHWIRMYRQLVRPKWIKGKSKDWLFLGKRGNKIYKQTVQEMVSDYAARSGIRKRITPHSLRHSCMSSLAVNGADVFSIQQLLGHSHLDTSQRYIQLNKDEVRKMLNDCHPREIYGNGTTD